jgi:hypothetical protein
MGTFPRLQGGPFTPSSPVLTRWPFGPAGVGRVMVELGDGSPDQLALAGIRVEEAGILLRGGVPPCKVA